MKQRRADIKSFFQTVLKSEKNDTMSAVTKFLPALFVPSLWHLKKPTQSQKKMTQCMQT
jgi:hypothetical protein